MKKRNKLCLLVIFATIFLLVSCSNGDDKPGNTGPNNGLSDGFIYNENSKLTIVVTEGFITDDNYLELLNGLNEVNSYEVINNSEPEADHEIVFGISDRAVSVEAYRRLANQTRETEQHVGYVIYSDGKSVAVAYDGPLYGLHIAEDVAIKHFLSEYMSASSLKLENGYVESVSFDAVEYQNNADMEYEEKRWESAKNSLASRAGSELAEKTIEALKRYYAISDSNRLVSWLADLYDAEIGGFYYSNSGRNTDGFLPDIESTYQAIGFLDTSGLASWAGGVDKLLPDVMKAKIVNWIKGLQDSENGYFYHPQWGKATTDQSLARRGRDLKWAENLLSRFGAHPTYNTPNGVKGDGILADGTPVAPASRITEAFGKSSLVTAISRVIAANDIDAGVAEHLKNDKNFIDYLNGLGIDQEDQSYPVGNTLEAQASQIVARDKVLKERGVDYSLVDILYDFLCEKQNKVTGMWERDGSTDYAANNGLMKIGSTILSVGKPIPNADKALMGAFKCITTEQLPNSVCDVFNTWVSVNSCISSIETYSSSDPTMAQIASEMRKTVLEQAPTLIDTTAEKFALFVKEDGSFSFGREKTSHTSQGLPVAVEGTNEGDINATCIAILSTTGHIFSVLKINRVPLCTSGDMLRFLATLENQGSIIKDRIADEREYATGNNYKKWGGDPYSYFSAASMKNVIREDTYIVTNVDFDYYEDGNKAKYKQEFINIGYDEERDTSYLRYGKSKEAGHYRGLYLKATNSSGASAIVFETDIKIDTVSSDALKALTATKGGYILNFKLSELIHEKAGIGGLNPTFDEIGRVYVFLDDDGGYYFRLGPALPPYMVNEDILGPVIKPGEWFNIAIEVYNNGVAKYYHGNKYICETDIGITPENFEKTNSIRFAFSPDAVNSAVHIDFTFIGKLSREYTKGDCIIDIGGFKFEAGEYYDNFGGYAYNSQPNGDSSSFFRHTSAGCWGETLDFVHSKQGLIYYQSAFKREGIAMIEKSDIKGQVSKVFEYCKGSAVDFYNGVYYTKHNDASEGGVFVFETDFKLEEINDATYTNLGAGGVIFDISLSDSSATGYAATKTLLAKIASVYLVRNTGGTYDWYFTNNRESYSSTDNFGTPLSVNDWHTLTVEVYGDGIAKYYVDGVCIGDRRLDVSPEVFGEAMYARIALAESVIASSVLLDNTFFGKVDKDYEAHKDGVPESPKPEEPDVPVTPPITPEVPETPADRAEADPFDQTPGSSCSNEGWT